MTAVLLALAIAQPATDETAIVSRNLAGRMGKAFAMIEEDPDEAVRLLTSLLNDPKTREMESRSPAIRAYREQSLYTRARIQIARGGEQAVIDDMTALIARKQESFASRIAGLVGASASPLPNARLGDALLLSPEIPSGRLDILRAVSLRAEAYKAMGRASIPAPSPNQVPTSGGPPMPVSRLIGSLIVAGSFALMLPVFFLTGMRQRRDAGGTRRRLFWVAFALAAMQATPFLAGFLVLQWQPGLFYTTMVPVVAGAVFGVNVTRHLAYLRPVRWDWSREGAPLLEDAAILDRISQIAARMGIAPPVTRLVRSSGALQTNNALIVGVIAPTMVLFDGILYRLAEEERDAIIAHELAHIANRTFWLRLVSGCTCGVVAVAASVFCPVWVALALEVALLTGTWLILSRRLELDCDRRAARAIGHRRAFSALSKIHTEHRVRGVLEFLAGALATHPSRDQRLDAVRRDAPPDDRPPVEWDTRLLVFRRLASIGAAGVWLAVVVGCLAWSCLAPGSNWPALPLALMPAGLFVFFWVWLRVTTRSNRRLQRRRGTWRGLLVGIVAGVFWGLFLLQVTGLSGLSEDLWATLAVSLGVLLVWPLLKLLAPSKADKLNHRIAVAIQSGDFPKALALAEGAPAVVAGSTELRYNYALIRVVLGRRAEALADLERLRDDDPSFKMTSVLLINLYADEGDYDHALELAEQLSRDLPGEPVGPQAESWLLRKLDRLEAAEARALEALEVDPRSGPAHLTLAAVAFDRGDHVAAREQLARAEKFVPGSTDAALFAAELALATEDIDAETAVRRAVNAARTNPLFFADNTAAALVERFEARHRSSPSELK